jgi:hypothetical protein
MQTNKQGAQPKLELSLATLEKIEDRISQMLSIQEHWVQYNLRPNECLNLSRALHREISGEIKALYKSCPAYSGAE